MDHKKLQAATEDVSSSGVVDSLVSFTEWLSKQVGRPDQVGKFAEVVKSDPNWPRSETNEENEEYLILRSYVRASIDLDFGVDRIAVFEKAWDEFGLRKPLLMSVAKLASKP